MKKTSAGLKRLRVVFILCLTITTTIVYYIEYYSYSQTPGHSTNQPQELYDYHKNAKIRKVTRNVTFRPQSSSTTTSDSIISPSTGLTNKPNTEEISGHTDVIPTAKSVRQKSNGNQRDGVSGRDTNATQEHATNIASRKKWKHPKEACIKRLPQAIVVGIQKCGTSALLTFLNAHPQIAACMHPVETKFFTMHYGKGLDWYRELMPCSYSDQITMEKSPPYFYRGYTAERIRKMNPNTKIIIIVKDPIVRTESMFAMTQNKYHGSSFERVLTTSDGEHLKTSSILLQFSNYQKHIRAWLKNFNLKQILFVDGHNLEENPAEELNNVEHFLGIGNYFTNDRFVFNTTKKKYCLRRTISDMYCLGANKGREHPTYSSNLRKLLEAYFRPLNNMFFDLIKRSFDWGY